MKRIFIIMAVALMVLAVGCSTPPEDVDRAVTVEEAVHIDETSGENVPIDTTKSSFTFTGYGPGKEHVGTFEEMEGSFVIEDGVIVGAFGTIQAASVKSDSTGLDKHLMNEDFFDVENFPEIFMESTLIDGDMLTGSLTFHGVTKQLQFPVEVTAESLSADTIINMEDFGISYAGVDSEVRIQFTLIK